MPAEYMADKLQHKNSGRPTKKPHRRLNSSPFAAWRSSQACQQQFISVARMCCEMENAGGWTMSMMWMRMPGHTWLASSYDFPAYVACNDDRHDAAFLRCRHFLKNKTCSKPRSSLDGN